MHLSAGVDHAVFVDTGSTFPHCVGRVFRDRLDVVRVHQVVGPVQEVNIDRLDAEFLCGAIRLEAEVARVGIDESRVGREAV